MRPARAPPTAGRRANELQCRLQLQGELQAKKDAPKMYRGVLHGISVILKNEGPKGLFRGINCAVR